MSILWCVTAAALVIAVFALLKARQSTIQVARLTDSYWELRYEQGQLASRLERMEAQLAGRRPGDELEAGHGATAFVPLSALKR